jgi:organic radical activating enzyme
MSIDAIADLTQNSGTKIAVITGGEPTMHDLTALTQAIQNLQIRTHIETSGTNPISGDWDWICFSPKRFKKPLEMYFELSHELKVVIAHKNDLRWAKEFEAKMHKNCKLYIQPEWDNRQEMTNLCIDFIKENPNWSLSLQTHKYIDIP